MSDARSTALIDSLIRRVFGLEQIRRHYSSSIGNGNHTSSTNGGASRSDDGGSSVGDKWNHGRVGAGDHEDADITTPDTRYSCEEYVADRNEDQGTDDVLLGQRLSFIDGDETHRWSLSFPIRMPSVSDDDKEGKGIRRHSE
jgi:hypothetical protein